MTAHHAVQCGKQGHVAVCARCNGALGVHGHPQDVPCYLLVARSSLKFVAQHSDSRKPTRDVPTTVIRHGFLARMSSCSVLTGVIATAVRVFFLLLPTERKEGLCLSTRTHRDEGPRPWTPSSLRL